MENKLLNEYLKGNKSHSKLKKYITKILILVILVLSSLIYVSINDDNLIKFKKIVFEDTFNFNKFKNFYQKINIIDNKKTIPVSKSVELTDYENYLDGVVFNIDSNYPVKALYSGIVIFIGNKEGYGNTVVIQGSDGYDIWYGSIDNVTVKMYDFVKKDTIIGEANQKLYLLITKDGKNIKYEDYQNKV